MGSFTMGVIVGESNKDNLQNFLNKAVNESNIYTDKAYEHCIKAEALRIQNYFFESIEEYLNSISYNNNNPDAFKGMGLSYKELGNISLAIEALETAKKLAPFDKHIYYELACCYLLEGKGCKAIKALIRAIKLDPKYIDAQFKLAIAHELVDEPEIAEAIYKKIIEQRKSYLAAYDNLGSLYIRLFRYQDAIKIFNELLKINPDFYRALLGIGVAFDKAGKRVEAMRYYKKYLAKKPNSGNARYINDRLAAIREERSYINRSHIKLIHNNTGN